MRASCVDCCRKHLSYALVISHELQWYAGDEEDDHFWVCVGHIGQAEEQIQRLSPFLADKIREQRLLLMKDGPEAAAKLELNLMIRMVSEFAAVQEVVEASPLGQIPDVDALGDLSKITKRSSSEG